MKAAIFGIGHDNYNFRKLEGTAKGFEELGYLTVSMHRPQSLQNYEIDADVAFIESDIPDDSRLSRFRTVIVWQNWNPSRIMSYAKTNPDTNFVLASKSIVHVPEFRKKYKERFGTSEYQRCHETREVINLDEFDGIDSQSQRISRNVTHVYAPLTVASDPRYEMEKDIDVVYFGTGANRPGVIEVLNSLPKNLRFAVNFIENSGPIHPEICIGFYRRAKVCLHEQISPVWGEFAVRFGEASAQGCRIVSLAKDFEISSMMEGPLTPPHESARTIAESVSKTLEWLQEKKEERAEMRQNTLRHSDLIKTLVDSTNLP